MQQQIQYQINRKMFFSGEIPSFVLFNLSVRISRWILLWSYFDVLASTTILNIYKNRKKSKWIFLQ